MQFKIHSISIVFVPALFLLAGGHIVANDVWWENTGEKYDYDLSGYRFVIPLGDDFDYYETVVLKEYWENWGARVDIAGMDMAVTGHLWKIKGWGWDRTEEKTIKPDLLVSEIDLSHYDALFFPGGNSPKNLLEKNKSLVVQLIQEAFERGLILSAICHGPQVFAAAAVVRGCTVTGHPDVQDDLEKAGGIFLNHVCVVDNTIITGNWPFFETFAVNVAEALLPAHKKVSGRIFELESHPVLKTIRERRSIRRFQDHDINENVVRALLRAATWAPSANNEQPWRFVVVRDKKMKQQILKLFLTRMRDYYEKHAVPYEQVKVFWSNIFSAPVFIFAFGLPSGETDKEFADIQASWNIQAVSNACQNILLAAKALDVGSCWIDALLTIESDIKHLLHVPDRAQFITAIALGHPADEPLPRVRKSLSDIVHYEQWRKDSNE
ncbi:MAG: nitroreductase family protein [candidate division WOR-3 bacterium]|nr:MAG: nitroreductase family protein [candidate division WOR-3 bacterium]